MPEPRKYAPIPKDVLDHINLKSEMLGRKLMSYAVSYIEDEVVEQQTAITADEFKQMIDLFYDWACEELSEEVLERIPYKDMWDIHENAASHARVISGTGTTTAERKQTEALIRGLRERS